MADLRDALHEPQCGAETGRYPILVAPVGWWEKPHDSGGAAVAFIFGLLL